MVIFIKQALERGEVALRAGAAPNRERGTCIKKEEDKKRVSSVHCVLPVKWP